MLREVVALLPETLVRCPPGPAAACAALGAMLWAVGARYSRSILALVAVAGGTIVGMRLPAWRGWQIDPMGVAVAAAIVLGTAAFLLHRTCIALLLGGTMMLWAGAATWIAWAGDVYWDWQSIQWDGDLVQWLRDAWQMLPPTLARVFPLACFAGLAAGIALTVFLPKLSRVLAHSLVGMTLLLVMGGVLLLDTRPDWLTRTTGANAVQIGLALALVGVGAVWQWRITPPHGSRGSNGATQHEPD